MSLRTLDLVERAVVLAVYLGVGVLVFGPVTLADPAPANVLVLVADCLVVGFVILRRRPEHISVRPSDWLVAVVGTLSPLLAGPADGPALAPPAVATAVSLLGMALSLLAKLSLRRNFSLVPARTGIVGGGPYRLVRHPMYSGYVVTHVGILLYGCTVRNLVCYLACWGLLWLRVQREEAVLAQEASYRAYCDRVPYRLVWGVL